MTVQHLAGHTFHGRKGAVANAFRYSIDYVLLDAEASGPTPALFSRNRASMTQTTAALQDRGRVLHGCAKFCQPTPCPAPPACAYWRNPAFWAMFSTPLPFGWPKIPQACAPLWPR